MELEELVQRIERWKQRLAAEEAGTQEGYKAEEENSGEAPLDIVEPVESEAEEQNPVSGVEEDVEAISMPPDEFMEIDSEPPPRNDDELN